MSALSLAQRSQAAVWQPCTQMQRAAAMPPLAIVRGQGPWLFDDAGRRYFDTSSSWWANLFGHADARTHAALRDQLDTLPHVMLAGCTHTSAVEIALKMSFHHWRNRGRAAKREFVCLRHGYHGETLGALAVTDVTVFGDAYDPLLMRTHRVMSPDARQALPGESALDVALRAAADLQALLDSRHEHIAALILEPLVQGATGMAMHDPAYLRAARAMCDKYDVLLIADEIAVGCGRTGTFFAFEQATLPGQPRLWPDLICLSKGISGGYLPLSVVLSQGRIYESFLDDDVARGFLHSHSYSGNALACRAGLAVLDRFEHDNVLTRNRQQASLLSAALAPLHADARLEHFRQIGMVWAFDVRESFAGTRFAERFHLAARVRELLIRPIGRTVYLMPPYVLDGELSAWLAGQLLATLDDVLRQTPESCDAARAPEPPAA